MAVELASGLYEKVFCKTQTHNTFTAFAATDAVSPLRGTFKLEPFQNFEELNEAVGTASHQGEIQTDRGGKWSGSFLVKPAAAGTAPDITALLTAAFGKETITGGTSAVYTIDEDVYTSLQFMHVVDGHWSHFADGAWVEQMVITVPGNGLATVEFSGGFSRFGWCYRDDVAGAEATAQTEIGIDDGSRGGVREPAMCEFEGDDNGGTGYLITGTDNTSGAAHFDISPGIAGAGLAAGAEILPLVLSQTTGGSALSAIECALTFGAVEPGFIEAKTTMTTGLGPRDKEATTEYASAVCRVGGRKIEADLKCYFTDTAAGFSPLVGFAHDGTTYDVDLRIGPDTAGSRAKLSYPKARLDIMQHDLGEILVVDGKIVARQSAAAEDEFALTFD